MNVTACDMDDCQTMVIHSGRTPPGWWTTYYIPCPDDPIACLHRHICPGHEETPGEWFETVTEATGWESIEDS